MLLSLFLFALSPAFGEECGNVEGSTCAAPGFTGETCCPGDLGCYALCKGQSVCKSSCPAGWDCETEPAPIPCDASDCSNQGTATGDRPNCSCTCDDGFTGETCSEVVPEPPTPCDASDCSNQGTASGDRPNCSCTCDDGFTGPDCSDVPPTPETCVEAWQPCHTPSFPQTCCIGTACVGDEYWAACQPIEDPECPARGEWDQCGGIGWEGETCCPWDMECYNMNDNYAVCRKECPAGWDCPTECTAADCSNHGTATGMTGDCSCECDEGWTGETCNVDPNACDASDCSNQGTATGSRPNCSCTCESGFTGPDCSEVAPPEACDASDCSNQGTATGDRPNCSCTCDDGFTGTTCSQSTEECVDPVPAWEQCGGWLANGQQFNGGEIACCQKRYQCVQQDEWYWQCVEDPNYVPEPLYLSSATVSDLRNSVVGLVGFLAQAMWESAFWTACDENWRLDIPDAPCTQREEGNGTPYTYVQTPTEATCGWNPNTGGYDIDMSMHMIAETSADLTDYGPMECKPFNEDGSSSVTAGCCWWGRGALQTTGPHNYGMVQRDIVSKITTMDIDLCTNPEALCQHDQLKFASATHYWSVILQTDPCYFPALDAYTANFDSSATAGECAKFSQGIGGAVNMGAWNTYPHAGYEREQIFNELMVDVQAALLAFDLLNAETPSAPSCTGNAEVDYILDQAHLAANIGVASEDSVYTWDGFCEALQLMNEL